MATIDEVAAGDLYEWDPISGGSSEHSEGETDVVCTRSYVLNNNVAVRRWGRLANTLCFLLPIRTNRCLNLQFQKYQLLTVHSVASMLKAITAERDSTGSVLVNNSLPAGRDLFNRMLFLFADDDLVDYTDRTLVERSWFGLLAQPELLAQPMAALPRNLVSLLHLSYHKILAGRFSDTFSSKSKKTRRGHNAPPKRRRSSQPASIQLDAVDYDDDDSISFLRPSSPVQDTVDDVTFSRHNVATQTLPPIWRPALLANAPQANVVASTWQYHRPYGDCWTGYGDAVPQYPPGHNGNLHMYGAATASCQYWYGMRSL